MTTTALPAPTAQRAPKGTSTFSILTELRRQASRPRTRIALACMVALPIIVLIAFEVVIAFRP